MIFYDEKAKSRNFRFLVYPESAPTDWMKILEETRCRMAISPVHDRDFDDETGELKKAHYHVLLLYPNTTTLKTIITRFTEPVNAPNPLIVYDLKGSYAYLTHKYNPEKAQYDEDKIIHLNGFNPLDIGVQTLEERTSIMKNLFAYIDGKKISNYDFLIDSLIRDEQDYLLDYVRKNVYMVKSYLDSKRKRKVEISEGESIRCMIDGLSKRMESLEDILDSEYGVNPQILGVDTELRRLLPEYGNPDDTYEGLEVEKLPF